MGKGTKKKGAIDPKVKKKRFVNKPIITASQEEKQKKALKEKQKERYTARKDYQKTRVYTTIKTDNHTIFKLPNKECNLTVLLAISYKK